MKKLLAPTCLNMNALLTFFSMNLLLMVTASNIPSIGVVIMYLLLLLTTIVIFSLYFSLLQAFTQKGETIYHYLLLLFNTALFFLEGFVLMSYLLQ